MLNGWFKAQNAYFNRPEKSFVYYKSVLMFAPLPDNQIKNNPVSTLYHPLLA